MRSRAALLVSALVVASCGGGGDPERAAGDACPLEVLDAGGEPVRLPMAWAGGWDHAGNASHIEAFDSAQPGIDVVAHTTPGFFDPPLELLGDLPPVLEEVSYVHVPALARAGAIQPFGPCLDAAGMSSSFLPGATTKATFDGEVYGASSLVDTTVLLYDRAAFRRAGLDPDAPPRTLEQLRAAGLALRERAGLEHPVAWDAPQLALVGHDIDSDDAREAARAWLALADDGLLIGPTTGDLPPVGSGEAALQWADPAILWGYASALHEGQAPSADLGVAPLPGLREPASGVGGGVWVVSASATPEQVAAAARFVAWFAEPPQQTAFHIGTDLFPSTHDAADTEAMASYWRDHPLIEAGWRALLERPVAVDDWELVLGSFATIIPMLYEVVEGKAAFDAQWPKIVDTIRRLEVAERRAPAALLRCLAAHIEDPVSPVRRCAAAS